MKQKKLYYAQVDKKGRLILPEPLVSAFNLRPGAECLVDADKNCLLLLPPVTRLTKVYIEPTTHCNLNCSTCIRKTWDESPGSMDDTTFSHLIDGLKGFYPAPVILFGGFGEPLMHPKIVEMVSRAKQAAASVGIVTNATLLTEEISHGLIEAGLDVLWVSLDGATTECYTTIRGAQLSEVIANIERFRNMRKPPYSPHPEIGIVFVAMKRNIHELPGIIRLGTLLGASRYLITNVLPYSHEMCNEVLYTRALSNTEHLASPIAPHIDIAKMDFDDMTANALFRVIHTLRIQNFANTSLDNKRNNLCPFIQEGSLAVSWDGGISPCLQLMHNHTSYLHEKKRLIKRYTVGNIYKEELQTIWNNNEFTRFREQVQRFDFAPCTFCGGCDLLESNEEDCFGNTFPVCGGCLWAQGVLQCP